MSIFQTHILGAIREIRKTYGVSRSSQWGKVRKNFLLLNPTCSVCNSRKGLNIHHREPFHLHPEKELDPSNLITLCRTHHFTFGHLENWKSYNVSIGEDASEWNKKIKERP